MANCDKSTVTDFKWKGVGFKGDQKDCGKRNLTFESRPVNYSLSFVMLSIANYVRSSSSETLFNMVKLSDDCCPDFEFASQFINDKNIKNRNYAVEWMKQVSTCRQDAPIAYTHNAYIVASSSVWNKCWAATVPALGTPVCRYSTSSYLVAMRRIRVCCRIRRFYHMQHLRVYCYQRSLMTPIPS